jgi:hypothetical protein
MPCPSIPTQLRFTLDPDNRIQAFSFPSVSSNPGYEPFLSYCLGQTPTQIMETSFDAVVNATKPMDQESVFYFYVLWDALRCALVCYSGTDCAAIDHERCRIEGIDHTEEGTVVTIFILPPKSLPPLQ